eukprot:304504-Amphidinium_carterae.2
MRKVTSPMTVITRTLVGRTNRPQRSGLKKTLSPRKWSPQSILGRSRPKLAMLKHTSPLVPEPGSISVKMFESYVQVVSRNNSGKSMREMDRTMFHLSSESTFVPSFHPARQSGTDFELSYRDYSVQSVIVQEKEAFQCASDSKSSQCIRLQHWLQVYFPKGGYNLSCSSVQVRQGYVQDMCYCPS